jgi:hypothetical protein
MWRYKALQNRGKARQKHIEAGHTAIIHEDISQKLAEVRSINATAAEIWREIGVGVDEAGDAGRPVNKVGTERSCTWNVRNATEIGCKPCGITLDVREEGRDG